MTESLKERSLQSVPQNCLHLVPAIVIPGAITGPNPGEHGFLLKTQAQGGKQTPISLSP